MADLLDTVKREAVARPKYWRDRDQLMDNDALMFLAFDELQDMKPTGYAKFKTNWMRVAVERTAVMITQNPARFRLPIEGDPRDKRDEKSRVEKLCRGMWDDIDTQLLEQGWTAGSDMISAKHLLLRGMAVAEGLMKDDEYERRKSPIVYRWWDPRFTYPYWDGQGLNSVIYAVEARLGDIMLEYDDAPLNSDDAEQRVKKYIWYDREYYAVACDYVPKGNRGGSREMVWLIPPKEHELDYIPVCIVGVNQTPLIHVPRNRPFNRKLDPNNTGLTKGQRPIAPSPQTLWAQSMFAGVRDAIPQYNEMMALMRQIIQNSAFGTWFYLTADGAPRFVELGAGAVNYDQLQTKIQRFDPGPLPQGLPEMIQALNREVQTSTIPAMLLTAGGEFPSGFDRAQALNVAMSAVFEYQNAHNRFKERMTQNLLSQFQDSDYTLNLRGYDSRRSAFKMTISGAEMTEYYPISVERKPAIPDDMMGRIQAARLAMDPANPVLDPWTVQDTILETEDPDAVIDAIWEWKAMGFPPLMFKVLMDALVRRGDPPEWLATILTADEAQQYALMTQKLMGMGQVQQLQSMLQPTGMNSSAQPPGMVNPAAGAAMSAGGAMGGMMNGGAPAPAGGAPPMTGY